MADLEAALADQAVSRAAGSTPERVLDACRTFVLDSLAVGIAGTSRPDAGAVQAAIARAGAGGEAPTLLGGPAMPAPSAALVDAFLIHGLEFDCVHEPAVVHPMASVLAATMAVAGRQRSAGRPAPGAELAAALVAGVDLAASLGMAGRGRMRFFRPATAGLFGATAGVARLLGLDADTTHRALGLALGQIPGTLQAHVEGSALLPLQMGFAARAAVQAVDLAVAGLSGPADWLTGPFGYLRLVENEDVDLAPLEALLGEDPPARLTEVSHKPFPSGRLTHGAIDGVGRLQAEHGFAAEEVDRVRVTAPPLVGQLVGRPPRVDMDPAYARLCLAWCAACRLVRGGVDVPDFTPAALADPAVLQVAGRVELRIDDGIGPTAIVPQTVEVTLAGGARHEIRLDHLPGSPAAPLDRAACLDKVRRCARHARRPLPAVAVERLIADVDGLAALPDAAVLADLAAGS